MWDEETVKVWSRTYRTHQHALQSAKFIAAGLLEVAAKFTIESGDMIGQGPAHEARRAGNSAARLTVEQWALWEAAQPQMKDAIYAAKFREGTLAARVLLATKDALMINDGKKKVICVRLMLRRDALARGRSWGGAGPEARGDQNDVGSAGSSCCDAVGPTPAATVGTATKTAVEIATVPTTTSSARHVGGGYKVIPLTLSPSCPSPSPSCPFATSSATKAPGQPIAMGGKVEAGVRRDEGEEETGFQNHSLGNL
jgi:hypothetical protein